MSLRKDFVLRALAGEETIAALCREFGISRKTGYKWLRRFKDEGVLGLVDRSRRPESSPLETSAELVLEIMAHRQEHPTWGPKKIARLLERSHGDEAPSRATVARVLKRAGMVRRKRRYRPSSKGRPTRAPNYTVDGPNDLWTVDFKGWWRTKDGARCEPLTVRDAHSRFVLALRILGSTRIEHVRPVFEELFAQYGLPKAILSDNGHPWASTAALGGMTRLSSLVGVSLGIELVRTRPGCPQDNGAHERMHADIRVEIQRKAARTRRTQQKACDQWRHEFNLVRPHEALDLRTPSELYAPSPRQLSDLIIGGYPDSCSLVRLSSPRAAFATRASRVYVGAALADYDIGLEPIDEGFLVWFFTHPIGHFNPDTDYTVQPLPFEFCHPSQVGS